MPKYTFLCNQCNNSTQLFCQLHDKVVCSNCNIDMKLQMPIISGQEVRETIDTYSNAIWKQDQKNMIKERKADYFWEVEVPRMVNSGIYTLETMLENGWVYYDDKNNLQTRITPPQKN